MKGSIPVDSFKQTIFTGLSFLLLAACNQVDSKSNISITNGDLVSKSDWMSKATLALVSESSEGSLRPYCSAVLISRDIALTAAHCLDLNTPNVTLAYGVDIKQSENVLRARSVVHENYAAPYNETFSFDIGILMLESPAPKELEPVDLAKDFTVGDSLLLAGYGLRSTSDAYNSQLYKTSATIKRVFDLDEDFSEYGLIVTRSLNDKALLCTGDSGGPAFVEKDEQLLLAGIIVGGYGKCAAEAYLTNVAFYADWINEASSRLRAPVSSGVFPEVLNQKEIPDLFENEEFEVSYRMLDEKKRAVELRVGPLPEVYGDRKRSYHLFSITHLNTHTKLRAYATFEDSDDGGNTLGWVEDSYGRVVARIDDSFFNPIR